MVSKPKVAVLLNAKTLDLVMSRADMRRLRSFATVVSRRPEKVDETTAIRLIQNADAAITGWGTPHLSNAVLDAAPGLRFVAHSAGTIKHLVGDNFWARKIRIVSCASAIGVNVAEFTLGCILTGLMRLPEYRPLMSQGEDRRAGAEIARRGLYDVTIGIVGAGFVGRCVIELLRCFNASVLLCDPCVTKEEARKLGVRKVGLDTLIKQSDIVSLHAPSLPSTRHMLNRANLKLLKPDAVLVNTARGALIDESALVRELRRHERVAYLDVTDPEPAAQDSPLRKLPNVILTPHIAGQRGNKRQGEYAVDELERFFKRRKLCYEVTQDMLARMA